MVPGLWSLWHRVCLGVSSTDGLEFPFVSHECGEDKAGNSTEGLAHQDSRSPLSSQGAEQGQGHFCALGRPGLQAGAVQWVPSQPQPRGAGGRVMSLPDAGSLSAYREGSLWFFFSLLPSCCQPFKHRCWLWSCC